MFQLQGATASSNLKMRTYGIVFLLLTLFCAPAPNCITQAEAKAAESGVLESSRGVRDESGRGEVVRGKRVRREGVRGEGVSGEGVRGEGVRGEGVKVEGARGEGVRGKGVKGEGCANPFNVGPECTGHRQQVGSVKNASQRLEEVGIRRARHRGRSGPPSYNSGFNSVPLVGGGSPNQPTPERVSEDTGTSKKIDDIPEQEETQVVNGFILTKPRDYPEKDIISAFNSTKPSRNTTAPVASTTPPQGTIPHSQNKGLQTGNLDDKDSEPTCVPRCHCQENAIFEDACEERSEIRKPYGAHNTEYVMRTIVQLPQLNLYQKVEVVECGSASTCRFGVGRCVQEECEIPLLVYADGEIFVDYFKRRACCKCEEIDYEIFLEDKVRRNGK